MIFEEDFLYSFSLFNMSRVYIVCNITSSYNQPMLSIYVSKEKNTQIGRRKGEWGTLYAIWRKGNGNRVKLYALTFTRVNCREEKKRSWMGKKCIRI